MYKYKLKLITLLLLISSNAIASSSISISEKNQFCTRFGELLAEAIETKLIIHNMEVTDSSYELVARAEVKKYGNKAFQQQADYWVRTMFIQILSQSNTKIQSIVDTMNNINESFNSKSPIADGIFQVCKEDLATFK